MDEVDHWTWIGREFHSVNQRIERLEDIAVALSNHLTLVEETFERIHRRLDAIERNNLHRPNPSLNDTPG